MGWSESAVEKMVATYAHTEIGALDAIDAAFATVSVGAITDARTDSATSEPAV